MTKLSFHVTLQDVAKRSQVSAKTVSRVVNHQGEISETTRQRVQSAIEELGYQPNILARSLVSQHSNTLAVVAWGIDYFGPSRIVVGIERQADALGYSLLLNILCRPDEPQVKPILDALVARRVEGILWAVPEVGESRAALQPGSLAHLPPIVFVNAAPRPGLTIAAIDNHLGGRLAAQHLLDMGRRTIGIITGPLSWWEARERYAGWRAALTEAGQTPDPDLVATGDWSAASGEQGLISLLARRPDLDAVFACNDQMALGAMGVAHRQGRRVPADLAVVGFDDTPEAAFFWPPLSTVRQRLMDVGAAAVTALHKLIQARTTDTTDTEEDAVNVTLLAPELVARASSGGHDDGSTDIRRNPI